MSSFPINTRRLIYVLATGAPFRAVQQHTLRSFRRLQCNISKNLPPVEGPQLLRDGQLLCSISHDTVADLPHKEKGTSVRLYCLITALASRSVQLCTAACTYLLQWFPSVRFHMIIIYYRVLPLQLQFYRVLNCCVFWDAAVRLWAGGCRRFEGLCCRQSQGSTCR